MSGLYSESERIKILESRIFALKDEIERMKREWIDPQRIVELAKRYTDEGNPGRVDIAFIDSDPDMCSVWSVDTRGIGVSGSNLSEVLRAAEES